MYLGLRSRRCQGWGGAEWLDLVLGLQIRGSDTTDAYLAALALERGCEWWTTDKGFDRFRALRSRNLLGG